LGGAIARVDVAETAFPHRANRFNIIIFTGWDDPADDAANIGWTRGLWSALRPFAAGGVYVNYLGSAADEEGNRVREAYGAGWERMTALKRAYDPTNLFRFNQNVAPA
jgi:FAD/FMN-containing dehydrogenase